MQTCAFTRIKEKVESPSSVALASLPFQIVDAHVHTKFSGKNNRFSGIPDTEESLLADMKANGVIGAIGITINYDDNMKDLSAINVIHCAGIFEKKVNVKRLEAGLKSKKFSCIKIYLGYIHQYANDKNYHVAYRLAQKYKVPVVFHTGDTSTANALLKYADPLQIDEIAVQYRDVNFVIAHLGNLWVETAAEVAYKNENVYADISAFLVGNFENVSPERWEEYVIKPIRWSFGLMEDPTKLLFGTDWPLALMGPYIRAVQSAIPPEHWEDVFYKNAMRVYKIPGLPASAPRK